MFAHFTVPVATLPCLSFNQVTRVEMENGFAFIYINGAPFPFTLPIDPEYLITVGEAEAINKAGDLDECTTLRL